MKKLLTTILLVILTLNVCYAYELFTEVELPPTPLREGGDSMVYIGDPSSISLITDRPITTAWETGIAQTIYLDEELTFGGLITGIMLVHNGGNSGTSPNVVYHFWLANTEKSVFSSADDWVPFSDFTHVFSGNISGFNQLGITEVIVEFDVTFPYSGGNLVLMGYKEFFDPWYAGNTFRCTLTPNQNRTLGVNSMHDNIHLPFDEYPWGTLDDCYANIGFFIQTGVTGTLSGLVTSNGNPLSEATISLVDTSRTAITNSLGQYEMLFITPDTYSVAVSKVGFDTVITPNIEIFAEVITTHDVELTLSQTLSVTGRIIASDTDEPHPDAFISLSGYANFGPVSTNINGIFTIDNVYVNQTYTLSLSALKYESRSFQIDVGSGPIYDLGDIFIYEISYPPRNVSATIQNEHAFIEWQVPIIPQENDVWFTHLHNEIPHVSPYGGINHWQIMHRYTQEQLESFGVSGSYLQRISIYLTEGFVEDFHINVYTGGSDSPLNPGTLIHAQQVPTSSLISNGWNHIELSVPQLIPTTGELWFGYVSTSLANSWKFAINDSPVSTTRYGDIMNLNNSSWITIMEYNGSIETWMIKGMASDGQVLQPVGNDFSRSDFSNQNRVFESYNIYRAPALTHDNSNTWVSIASNVTALNYLDTTWENAEGGDYRYVVTAVYSNNNESVPAFSQTLKKLEPGHVYIGDPSSDITVLGFPFTFYHHTGLAQSIYLESEISTSGLITGISYEINGMNNVTSDVPIKVWLATTNKTHFVGNYDGWEPGENFTMVYEGFLSPPILGWQTINIDFTTPFNYDGGNLVVMTQRLRPPNLWWEGNAYRHSQAINRGMFTVRDGEPHDIYNPDYGQIDNTIPNIILKFNVIGTGTLSGYVTTGDYAEPVADARISIDGTLRETFSDIDGFYLLQHITPGNINITISKDLYLDSHYEDIHIVSEENAIQNVTLLPRLNELSAISINGTLLPSVGAQQTYYITLRNISGELIYGNDYNVRLMRSGDVSNSVENAFIRSEFPIISQPNSERINAFPTGKMGTRPNQERINAFPTAPGQDIAPGETISIPIIWTPEVEEIISIYGFIDYPDDVNPNDNTTESIIVNIQKYGTTMVYIGNPDSEQENLIFPFNYTYHAGLAQTIYRDYEIASGGLLTDIVYRFRGANPPTIPDDIPHKIWMAVTDVDEFENVVSWIPYNEFTLVYEGFLPTNLSGLHDIFITLDTPFPYGNGNLVIMTQRFTTGDWWSGYSWHSTVMYPQNRSIHARRDGTDFDPMNPPTATALHQWIPNIYLVFNTVDMGFVSGVISTGNPPQPLPNAEIKLTGTERRVFTNENGEYLFNYAPAGMQNFTVSKHGYITKYFDIEVIHDETSNQDVHLDLMPLATISGRIMASDTMQALADAKIEITGYDNFITESNINGYFSIFNVYQGHIYTLSVSKKGYITYVNNNLLVHNSVINLNDIILEENPFPPTNVRASIINDNVTITWEPPGDGTHDVWFSHTIKDELEDSWGGTWASAGATAVHRWTPELLHAVGVAGADLTRISFHIGAGGGGSNPPTTGVIAHIHVWTGGTGIPLHPGSHVYSQAVDNVIIGDWNEVVLNTPVKIPLDQELWFGYHATYLSGFPFSVTDGGNGAHGYGYVIFKNGVWAHVYDTDGYDENWMIRGMASNVPIKPVGNAFIRSDFSIHSQPNSERPRVLYGTPSVVPSSQMGTQPNQEGINAFRTGRMGTQPNSEGINAFRTGKMETQPNQERINAFPTELSAFPTNLNAFPTVRIIESYNIYRVPIDEELNPLPEDNWSTIATTITDLSFTDEDWSSLQEGNLYRYGVQAVYTNENMSNVVFSNHLGKGMNVNVIVNLVTSDGGFVEDAVVTLMNNNGNPLYFYQVTSSSNQILVSSVWKGEYTLNVSAKGYADYDNNLILINTDPFTIDVPLHISRILLSEGFEGQTFPPENWSRYTSLQFDELESIQWHRNTDPWNGASPFGMASAVSRSWFPSAGGFEPNNYLITPIIEIPTGLQTELSFKVKPELNTYDDDPWGADKYSIYISTQGNSPTDFTVILFEETFPILNEYTEPFPYWLSRTVNLSDYAGLSIYVAIRHWDCFDESAVILDEVVIKTFEEVNYNPPTDVIATAEEDHATITWQKPEGNFSTIMGYNVYRSTVADLNNEANWSTIAVNLTDLEHIDSWESINPGDYYYHIKAVYAGNVLSVAATSNLINIPTNDDDNPIKTYVTKLHNNFPNPFNPSTTISFDVEKEGVVSIMIYNIRGQKIKTLINESYTAGEFSVKWEGKDDWDREVTSGVYFYQMTIDDYKSIKRMVLMK